MGLRSSLHIALATAREPRESTLCRARARPNHPKIHALPEVVFRARAHRVTDALSATVLRDLPLACGTQVALS